MAKVSVVIPVYNGEQYLNECLDSIINQTYNDLEIICIDDGSNDESRRILEWYSEKDSRFIILLQNNKGAASARNYGITVASGKYILFLDCDDVFNNKLIEKCIAKAECYDADIVIFKALAFNTINHQQFMLNDAISHYLDYSQFTFSVNDIHDKIFNSFLVQAWNKFYKREFIKEHKLKFQDIKRSNDLYFSQLSLVVAKKIILLDEFLLHYRVGMKNNLQSGNANTPLEFYKALIALKIELEKRKTYSLVKKSFLILSLNIIFYNLNSINNIIVKKQLTEQLKNQIFNKLDIVSYKEIFKINPLLGMQYLMLVKFDYHRQFEILYEANKFFTYYSLHGLKAAIKKAVSKF